MTTVDQFIRDTELQRRSLNTCQVKLVMQTSYQDKPVRSYGQYFFTAYLSCSSPVSQWIFISPSTLNSMCFSYLITNVGADHQWIVFIPLCKGFCTLKKHIFRILIRPPQSVTIVIVATPHRTGGMIIENHHQSNVSEYFDGVVKYFHSCLADQLGIGFEIFWLNDLIIEVQLQGVGQSDAI